MKQRICKDHHWFMVIVSLRHTTYASVFVTSSSSRTSVVLYGTVAQVKGQSVNQQQGLMDASICFTGNDESTFFCIDMTTEKRAVCLDNSFSCSGFELRFQSSVDIEVNPTGSMFQFLSSRVGSKRCEAMRGRHHGRVLLDSLIPAGLEMCPGHFGDRSHPLILFDAHFLNGRSVGDACQRMPPSSKLSTQNTR